MKSLAIEEFQIEPLWRERIREELLQIGHLDLEILDLDQVDDQIRVELAQELAARATGAAEITLQLGRNCDGFELLMALQLFSLKRII